MPGMHIDIAQLLSGRTLEEDIQRLALVHPFATISSNLYQPGSADLKNTLVLLTEAGRNGNDLLDAAIAILQLFQHGFIPESELFQILDEVLVYNSKLAAHIGLH